MLKKYKMYAVMPKHQETFSLVWDRYTKLFANALFRSKQDALIYRRDAYRKINKKAYPLVIVVAEVSLKAQLTKSE